MELRSYRYFINRLKTTRCQNNITLEEIGKSASFSKSYVSKIENNRIIIDNEYLKSLSNLLGLDYFYGKELVYYGKLLNDFYIAIVFYRIKEAQQLFYEIEDHSNIYLNSDLIITYTLYNFLWYVTISIKPKLISYFQKRLDLYLSENIPFTNNEMQIYYDCLGCIYMDNKDNKNAIAYFNKALDMGIFKYSYSMVCYHLGKAHDFDNNFVDAKYYESIALRLFTEEININRQLFTQVHIATIYGKTRKFDISENMYKEIIEKCIDINNEYFINIIKTNLSWLLIRQRKYSEAITLTLSKKESDFLGIDYFHLVICYYYLNDYKKAMHLVNECKHIQIIDEYVKKKIDFFEIILTCDNYKNILSNLKKQFKEIENDLPIDEKCFYIDILISFCKKSKQYKEALRYASKLISLIRD